MGIKILELWAINTNGELPFKYTNKAAHQLQQVKENFDIWPDEML